MLFIFNSFPIFLRRCTVTIAIGKPGHRWVYFGYGSSFFILFLVPGQTDRLKSWHHDRHLDRCANEFTTFYVYVIIF